MRRVVFAVMVACSSSPPSQGLPADAPDPTGDAIVIPDGETRADVCNMYATATCMQMQTCSAARLSREFADLATCVARKSLDCTHRLGATDTGETEATMLACSAALVAEACPVFLGNFLPAACITPGPNTGTCAYTEQCGTSFCAIANNAACGVCQDSPTSGASCAASGCGNSLICDVNNQCEAPVEVGKACNPNAPCDHALSCVGATTQQNGTCQAEIATLGGACDSTRKTRPLCSADAGLTCSTTTAQCVAMPLVGAGSACGTINGTDTECKAGGTCAPTTKCVAPAGDGSACDTKNGPDCLFPARCIPSAPGLTTGTCQFLGTSQSC